MWQFDILHGPAVGHIAEQSTAQEVLDYMVLLTAIFLSQSEKLKATANTECHHHISGLIMFSVYLLTLLWITLSIGIISLYKVPTQNLCVVIIVENPHTAYSPHDRRIKLLALQLKLKFLNSTTQRTDTSGETVCLSRHFQRPIGNKLPAAKLIFLDNTSPFLLFIISHELTS